MAEYLCPVELRQPSLHLQLAPSEDSVTLNISGSRTVGSSVSITVGGTATQAAREPTPTPTPRKDRFGREARVYSMGESCVLRCFSS
jgi:hypothetical protein